MARWLAISFLVAFVSACGRGTPSGPFTPGTPFQTLSRFQPQVIHSEEPIAFELLGTGLGPVGQPARVHFQARAGTPFDGARTAHREFPATIDSATTVTGVTGSFGTDEQVRVDVTLILPGGTTLALPASHVVLVNGPRLFNTGLEEVTPLVPEDLEVEGNGFGPLEDPVLMRFHARTGTPFDGGDSSTMELNGEIASASLLRVRFPYVRMHETFEADLEVQFPSGVVATNGPYTFAPGVRVQATDTAGIDRFGAAVAAEGDTVVVGAPGAEAAYVYTRGNGTWPLEWKLEATSGSSGDSFGSTVAVSGDSAIVGAPDGSEAYAFRRSGTTWLLEKTWTSPGDPVGFGTSVAIHGDVAAISRLSSSPGVRVASRGGGVWTDDAWLTPATGAPQGFGRSIAIEQGIVAAGAFLDDEHATDAGAVYVYEGAGTAWLQRIKLMPASGGDNTWFGYTVALSPTHLAVGAPGETHVSGGAGSVYLYRNTSTGWQFDAKILPPAGAESLLFGISVALQGTQLVVGAPSDGGSHGAVYVYGYENGAWIPRTTLLPWWPSPLSEPLGSSVAASADAVVSGSPSSTGVGHACVH